MYTHGHICHFKQPKNPAESSAFSPQVLFPSNIRFNHMTSVFEFVRCCCAVSTTHIGKERVRQRLENVSGFAGNFPDLDLEPR